MKLSAFFCLCLFIILLFGADTPVSADVYQFVDETGATHYTNDPASIPEQYQNSVNIKGEIRYLEPLESPTSTGTGYQSASTPDRTQQPQESLGETGALKDKELAFNNEFQALEEEREMLNKARQQAKTNEEILKNNEQITEFNTRLKDFHQRLQAFREEVREHNKQVMKDMEQKMEQYRTEQEAQED